jgi:hypothetical protein
VASVDLKYTIAHAKTASATFAAWAERTFGQLPNLSEAPSASPAGAEDGSFDPAQAIMAMLKWPGYQNANLDARFVAEMERIGALEGFSVQVLSNAQDGSAYVPDLGSVWTEDWGEIGVNGTLSYQASFEPLMPGNAIEQAAANNSDGLVAPDVWIALRIIEDRVRRFYPEVTPEQLLAWVTVAKEWALEEIARSVEELATLVDPEALRAFPDKAWDAWALADGLYREGKSEGKLEDALELSRTDPDHAAEILWKTGSWFAGALSYLMKEQGLDLIQFSALGGVNQSGGQWGAAQGALALGRSIRENFSYIEGGDVLIGQRSDGQPYALVGQDAIVVTRGRLEADLGQPVTEGDAVSAIAKDLGLTAEQVIPVEQPGSFHLDMEMSLLPGGKLLMNDPVAAVARVAAREREKLEKEKPTLAKELGLPDFVSGAVDALGGLMGQDVDPAALEAWEDKKAELEEKLAHLQEQAERQAQVMERTVADLEAAGLEVHRVVGAFPEVWVKSSDPLNGLPIREHQSMNFLNAEQGIGKDGKRFYITLGGTPEAEAQFEAELRAIDPELGRVYFLPPELTEGTLRLSGGISCRVKLAAQTSS